MPDPVIDDIKQRLDIADFVSQTVQLKRAGKYLKGLCPFHQEKTPSFYVYPDQGTYHCFGCGKHGDVFTWVQETERLEFGEALRKLADRAGVTLPERAERRPDPVATAAADALTESAAWYVDLLLRQPEGERARQYLERRGVTRPTIERFGIGWAPDRGDALTRHLRAKGVSDEQIVLTGLARETERGLQDYQRGRVVFPIRDADGKVRGFGGRTLGDGQPKYLNSPQTPFFDKSALLYGLDLARQAIRREGTAVIVEGYMDTVVPHQEGFTNVVASLGTSLTEKQLELIKRYASTIVLALDADAAGQAATLRGLEVARGALADARRPVPGRVSRSGFLQTTAAQLKIAVLSGGKDPDEVVREDPKAWQQAIDAAVPMMDHKLEVELARVDHRSPQTKVAAVEELARFLVQVPDPIEWAHYVDLIAQRLRIDIATVKAEVQRAARAAREDERRQEASRRAREAVRAPAPGEAGDAPLPDDSHQPPAGGERPSTEPARRGRREAPAVAVAVEGEPIEEHLLSLLVTAPHLLRRLPSRPMPDDFRRPECRELYRALVAHLETPPGAPAPRWPGASTARPERDDDGGHADDRGTPGGAGRDSAGDDSFRPLLDAALRGFYDALRSLSRQRPPQTDSQREADAAGAVRRIRERNIRERVREAQYLLVEAESDEERASLERQVAQLTSQLMRVQLEQSRASLYTSTFH